jgi:hypothetical protein
MCKWPRVIRGTSEVLVIGLHMVGNMSMGLDLEILLKSPPCLSIVLDMEEEN